MWKIRQKNVSPPENYRFRADSKVNIFYINALLNGCYDLYIVRVLSSWFLKHVTSNIFDWQLSSSRLDINDIVTVTLAHE